jgi:hypothetical protein
MEEELIITKEEQLKMQLRLHALRLAVQYAGMGCGQYRNRDGLSAIRDNADAFYRYIVTSNMLGH